MSQKTIMGSACKVVGAQSHPEAHGLEFLNFSGRETNLKSLDQALHNVLLGRELISVVRNACGEIETILSQVKHWISPSSISDTESSERVGLEVNISLKLRELDQVAETFKHKGQKLLGGSLSASARPESHSYLVVGAHGSPENRVNLNTSLNIPTITSKSLGLGSLTNSSPQKQLQDLMVLENALRIITRLQQRSQALDAHLQGIQIHLATAIENHHAANSAPDSHEQAVEFLRATSILMKKSTGE